METQREDLVLELKNVGFGYNKDITILDDVHFQIRAGEKVGLLGANGAGKSTLMKLIVGLELGFTGQIEVCRHALTKDNLKHVRNHIGFVFQDSDSQLFMPNVYDDVAFAPRNYGLSEEEIASRVENALNMVHITHLSSKPIYQLSGGEKKLASIATILSMTPDVILLDEPSVALDPKNRRNLINVLLAIDSSMLIASHDLDFIYDTCTRVILLDDGKIIADGATEDVLKNKELLEAHSLELPLRFQ